MSALDLQQRRGDAKPDPRMQPHILVITVGEPGGGEWETEKDFEIEHPDSCPLVCYWSPHMREIVEREQRRIAAGEFSFEGGDGSGHRDCFVQYEVENIGLDGLDLGEDPPDDGTYTPTSQWAMDRWRQLPAGRYIVEPWFSPPYSAGPYGEVEAEGGLNLIGPEPA